METTETDFVSLFKTVCGKLLERNICLLSIESPIQQKKTHDLCILLLRKLEMTGMIDQEIKTAMTVWRQNTEINKPLETENEQLKMFLRLF